MHELRLLLRLFVHREHQGNRLPVTLGAGSWVPSYMQHANPLLAATVGIEPRVGRDSSAADGAAVGVASVATEAAARGGFHESAASPWVDTAGVQHCGKAG